MSSARCGGNCECGDGCTCGTECAGGGCKLSSVVPQERIATTETVSPTGIESQEGLVEGSESGVAEGENRGCKCGPKCTCNPCNCK